MNTQQAVDFLNEALRTDQKAVEQLCKTKVKVNQALCDHPRVLISMDGNLSLVGILNSILCRGDERIEALYDVKSGELLSFRIGRGYQPL